MSLVPYYGEFLVSPVPLELSLGTCSHGCRYCFANLGKPAWRANLRSVLNLLAESGRRHTLAAHLLRGGYPVLLSNRSDPFSASCRRQALPVLETLAGLGIPVAIQTKGGDGADEAAEMLPPSVWYVTLTTLDEDLAGKIEPGAPGPAARLALIERLVAKGHRVVHGFNPCVPAWAEPEEVLAATKQAGAEGVWIECLHFNSNQEKAMGPAHYAALGEENIRRARKLRIPPEWFEHILRARDAAQALGLEVFTGGQPIQSGFWRPWRECYGHTFPVMQDLINDLHAEPDTGTPRLVTFAEWSGYFLGRLPRVAYPFDGQKYIVCLCSSHRWPYREGLLRAGMDWPDILAAFWSEPRLSACPANLPSFAYASQGGELVRDDEGRPVLVFCREPVGSVTVEV